MDVKETRGRAVPATPDAGVHGISRAETLVEVVPRRHEQDDTHRLGRSPYRHMVVALDGSELAEEIFPAVIPLARAFGSHVTLLRVVAPLWPPTYAGDIGGYSARAYYDDMIEMAKRAQAEAADYLALHRERLEDEGLRVSCRTAEGAAAEVISEYARAAGADLIAMTTHGRGGLGRLVFGSVTEAVLRSAPCPVLVVRVQND